MGTRAGETVNAGGRDPVAPAGVAVADAVPWLQIVRFHREMASRDAPDAGALQGREAGGVPGSDWLREYQRLEALLTGNPLDCGGLALMEGSARTAADAEPEATADDPADLLAAVSLDESQRRAVRRGLRRDRLTLVEGRAGSGKTEVVLALLLNAWATGRRVLLVGAGESSVDVAAARLEPLGLQVPIAVRIGPGWRGGLPALLRQLLRLVRPEAGGVAALPDAAALKARRQVLEQERALLAEALHSDLSGQVRAAAAAVLAAQAEVRERFAALEADESDLRVEQQRLGLGALDPEAVEPALNATRRWLDRMADFREQARDDGRRRSQLDEDIRTQERQRDQAVAEAGVSSGDVRDWDWLLDVQRADPLTDWERRFAALLGEPLEVALAPLDWRTEYSRWRSAVDARAWAAEVQALATSARQLAGQLEQELERTRGSREDLERQRVKIRGLGLPEDFDPKTDMIPGWLAAYRELQGHAPRALDALPWSAHARLLRRIRRLERQLLSVLPPAVRVSVGTMDPRGRTRLAAVLQAAQRWAEMRLEQERIRVKTEPQRSGMDVLRLKTGDLGLADMPTGHEPAAWVRAAMRMEDASGIAELAALAWDRRRSRENVQEALRKIAREWAMLKPGTLLFDAWRRGGGRAFDRAVRTLAVQPDAGSVAVCRDALAQGLLSHLRRSWESAANHEHSARRLRTERAALPGTTARRDAWVELRPAESLLDPADASDGVWPDPDAALARLDRVADWCVRWRFFRQEDEPQARQHAEATLTAATCAMERLVRPLPPDPENVRLLDLLDSLRRKPESPVPEAQLWGACSAFNPDGLRRRIQAIDREVEQGLLEHVQAQWLARLRDDAGTLRAAESLVEPLDESQAPEVPEPEGGFRTLLRVLPVWLTDIRELSELPMEPGLFDLVIIDDAAQATVTALLPAIFRARSLVVIGDARNASAFRRADVAEDAKLAGRLGVTDWLARLGWAAEDHVLHAATAALARRPDDRISLTGSYRGHPEVLALASRLLYPYQPLPRSDGAGCSWGWSEPGVDIIDVAGRAEPGPGGHSWVNPSEVARVVERVRDLRRRAPGCTLAVITPFRAQRDRLREELQDAGSASGLTIGLPGAAQGREWDVVVFSPVVARGMSVDARRRVDVSPGLFAIALTRARDALHVIGDLEFCLEQDDMLREFALHCQDLCRVRQDSPDAAGLFTAMLLEGWIPAVQACIGDIRVDLALEAGPGRRLAIEVDGGEARHGSQRARAREAYLDCMGYRLLRLQGESLREDPSPVIARIRSELG